MSHVVSTVTSSFVCCYSPVQQPAFTSGDMTHTFTQDLLVVVVVEVNLCNVAG